MPKLIPAQRKSDKLYPGPRLLCVSIKLAATLLLACVCAGGFAQIPESEEAFLPSPVRAVSTVPANGDGNPYGVAFVPNTFRTGNGLLHHGDILVSNFNNSANLQGTGTTIMRIPSGGAPTVFFQGKAGIGLSTALGTLQYGFVVVGNAPSTDGTANTATAGSLLVIDSRGKLVQTIASPWIQSPWDMTLVDQGDLAIAFVTNALNGTVSRLTFHVSSTGLKLLSATTIASGYFHRGDPVTFFVAPTGLVFDARHDRLYVASTGDNAIFEVWNAATRQTDDGPGYIIYADDVHLHGPLGLAATPNGHLLVTNNDGINPDSRQPSEIVEFTKDGTFIKQIPVDPAQGGSFGLAVNSTYNSTIFAAVDDNTSSLIIWTLNPE